MSTILLFIRAKWVKVGGTEYRRGTGVIHCTHRGLPQVAEVSAIYVVNGARVVFKCRTYRTEYHNEHFRLYCIHPYQSDIYISSEDLLLPNPVFIRYSHALDAKGFLAPFHIHCSD